MSKTQIHIKHLTNDVFNYIFAKPHCMFTMVIGNDGPVIQSAANISFSEGSS